MSARRSGTSAPDMNNAARYLLGIVVAVSLGILLGLVLPLP